MVRWSPSPRSEWSSGLRPCDRHRSRTGPTKTDGRDSARDDVEPRLRTTGAPRHRSIRTASWALFASTAPTPSNGGLGARPIDGLRPHATRFGNSCFSRPETPVPTRTSKISIDTRQSGAWFDWVRPLAANSASFGEKSGGGSRDRASRRVSRPERVLARVRSRHRSQARRRRALFAAVGPRAANSTAQAASRPSRTLQHPPSARRRRAKRPPRSRRAPRTLQTRTERPRAHRATRARSRRAGAPRRGVCSPSRPRGKPARSTAPVSGSAKERAAYSVLPVPDAILSHPPRRRTLRITTARSSTRTHTFKISGRRRKTTTSQLTSRSSPSFEFRSCRQSTHHDRSMHQAWDDLFDEDPERRWRRDGAA